MVNLLKKCFNAEHRIIKITRIILFIDGKGKCFMGNIISEDQYYVPTKNGMSIHLSNASLWQMRDGNPYKLSEGTEQEARPYSNTHIGPSQPRGWFSRVSGTRFN